MHRFNDVRKTLTGLSCTRTVESLWDRDTEIETTVSNQTKPLYLVFVSYKPGKTWSDQIEIQRQCIRVDFQ